MGLNYKKLITSIVDGEIEEKDIPNFKWKDINEIISTYWLITACN